MERLEKYIYELENLNQYLDMQDNIVVYGAGDYGKGLVDYIISRKQEKKIKGIVVTEMTGNDFEYRGIKIYEAIPFLEECGSCHVLIAASLPFQNDIACLVSRFDKEYLYLTNDIYMAINEAVDARERVPYQGIDFLLAGFTKCGTTSLHDVLIRQKDIYLSGKKESQYFSWYNQVEDPEKVLIDKYFNNIRKGQIVGMIEPTFARKAEEIYSLFGSNIKVIFCVRNPVDVTFSRFKMGNRNGRGDMEELYKSHEGMFYSQMFDDCFQYLLSSHIHEYARWIKEFEKYYPKEQIKIIFFEEMIKDPQSIINDLLEYIGISDKCDCKKLPVKNEGNFVMADLEGYRAAQAQANWRRGTYALGSEEIIRKRYDEEAEYLRIINRYDQADKIYGLKMTEEQRGKLELYFNSSVRQLEKMLNKDLSKIWY